MSQYWLYTTSTISRELLAKLLSAFSIISIMNPGQIPGLDDNPAEISIESLCLVSRMIPSMLMVSGVAEKHPELAARADILERVICKTWEIHPRLY